MAELKFIEALPDDEIYQDTRIVVHTMPEKKPHKIVEDILSDEDVEEEWRIKQRERAKYAKLHKEK